MDMINLLIEKFGFFLIVFSRVSGIFSMAPVYGSRNLPTHVKIGLGFFITLILFPVITSKTQIAIPQELLPYIALVIMEFLVGLIIGYISFLIFAAIQMAGSLLDTQVGFGIVSVLDPQSGTQMPLLGTFKYVLAILLFLGTNGHHVILAALSESFRRVPVGTAVVQDGFYAYIIKVFSTSFAFAFKIALPVLVTLFLVDVAFGIMARTVPQMNVFMVGMPAKIIVGLFILALALPVYITVVQVGFTGMYSELYRLMDLLHR